MAFTCQFLFHGNLADFLRPRQRGQWISFTMKKASSAKDAIEAIGVPHVEVGRIMVNDTESMLAKLLQPADCIDVFPIENGRPGDAPPKFVLDVHLGKLARLLRMLGIDSFYQNDLTDSEIVSLAVSEQRAVLTRDIGLLKHKVLTQGYWLRSQQPEEQLKEVVNRFSLSKFIKPFSRCLVCNGTIQAVGKADVCASLPQQTILYFEEFFQCSHCQKVYWKGSHFEHMQRLVERLALLARQ